MRHFLKVTHVLVTTMLVTAALSMSLQARAACGDVSLERALLVRGISEREPLGTPVEAVSADDYALYAFTEITGAKNRQVIHTWYHDNQETAVVRLSIGADRWRTWSSKRLGFRRDNNWRVEIRLGDGCLLATLAPGDGTAFGQIAERIQSLLERGDVTGARLALGEARQQSLLPTGTLDRLATRDVPLAQVAALLDEGNLYIARARLQPVSEAWPENEAVLALQKRLTTALAERSVQVTVRVEALQRLLAKLPSGAGICGADSPGWWQHTLDAEDLLVVERRLEGKQLRLLLLDSRSGQTLALPVPCLAATH